MMAVPHLRRKGGHMGDVDKRGRLEAQAFDYDVMKDGRVFIYWERRHVTTLKGEKARKFLAQIEGANEHEAQLVMAKVTGNFKRGNEREGKHHGR